METIDALRILLRKHIAGTLTRIEKKELLQSLETTQLQPIWKEVIAELSSEAQPVAMKIAEWEPMIQQILAEQPANHTNVARMPLLKTAWFRYAAAILGVLAIGTYLWMQNRNGTSLTTNGKQTPIEIQPRREGTILILADGTQVNLDSTGNRLIATQNGSDVKMVGNQLTYELTGNAAENTGYNTMQTPKGKQFKVQLPDGTNAWLNAESSIRFPTVFNDSARNVEITGEVYFEVARKTQVPFSVTVANKMNVVVLGTSFNIQAYNDEPNIKTTLLEGSIKVLKAAQPHSGIILEPGQQTVFSENITINKTVDVEQVLAWKNGVFNFNGATLEEFMRQIARWYDLKIIYQGAIPHKIFKGELGRDLQLSQIMKLLTQFNIEYQLSGNTITIESQ